MPGVREVTVDLRSDEFTISYDEQRSNTDEMQAEIVALGYSPSVVRSRIAEISNPSTTGQSDPETAPEPVAATLVRADKSGSYIFLDFYAKWCGACKIMEKTTLIDPGVLSVLDKFEVLKVDADEYPDAIHHYRVVGMPTYVVLDSLGSEVYRHIGPIDSDALIAQLSIFGKD